MGPTNDNTKFRGGASSESNQPIRFAGSMLGAQRHVCAFFHNPDEEWNTYSGWRPQASMWPR